METVVVFPINKRTHTFIFTIRKRDSRPTNEGCAHFSNKETRFRYEHMLRRSRSLARLAISFPIKAKLADSADSRKTFREIGK